MNIIGTIAVTMVLTSCSSFKSPNPQENYNVTNAIQTASDYLMDTRHFDYSIETLKSTHRDKEWLLFDKYQSILINQTEWQQIFITVPKLHDNRSKAGLETNLSRTCWSLRDDADIDIQYGAFRGVDTNNTLTACVSKRLGPDYPLFIYNWITDVKVDDYFMMVAPKHTSTDRDYRCKLVREGYDFSEKPNCIGV
jgi:hypothetical protein